MIPAIVTQIAQQAAQDERGVVSAQFTRNFSARAAFSSRHDSLSFTGVYQDGTLVSIHITKDTIGEKDADAAQRAQATDQYVHPRPAAVFHAPWDPRFLNEYSYTISSPTTIAFTSLVKDTSHGSGTFTIDGHDHVVSYQYVMSANWPYATFGQISGQRVEVLPGYWAMVSQTEEFRGRYSIFSGRASADVTQTSFQRFATVADAVRAANPSQ
jgi:hypothetical protein